MHHRTLLEPLCVHVRGCDDASSWHTSLRDLPVDVITTSNRDSGAPGSWHLSISSEYASGVPCWQPVWLEVYSEGQSPFASRDRCLVKDARLVTQGLGLTSLGISLDYLCRDRAQTVQLEGLSGSVLGIEVDHYLRKTIQQSRTPLFTPWAGVAQQFLRTVAHDLSVLERLDIKPVFVFAGLQVVLQHSANVNARLAARTQALGNLERKRNDETVQAFAALTSPSDLIPVLKQYLRAQKHEFFVAPYFASAQLAYLLKMGSVDSIYGAPDLLVFGTDRVITDISFSQVLRATFCDRHTIFAFLQGVSEDQFLDAYLFAGNEFCPIVPILEPNPPSEYSAFRMRAAADVVRQNGTGYLALNGNPALDKKPKYLDEWLEARALFRHHPYLNLEGDVVLSKADKAPSDVARVIGARLPREVYFYISRGLVEPRILDALLSGVWRELMPLDGGDMREFRNLLDSLHDVRVQCLDLLHGSKQLHHYYEKKVIVTNRWYQEDHNEAIEKLDAPLNDEIKEWALDSEQLQNLVGSSAKDLRSLLGVLKDPREFKGIDAAGGKPRKMAIQDVHFNTMYRVLHLRGYIATDRSLTDWGRALLKALMICSEKISINVFVAVEMLKLRSIKAEDFSARLLQEAPEKEPVDAQWKVLGRIAALLPLQQNDAPWQGPIDREALVSFSLAQTVAKHLASLYEMCQLSIFLRSDVQRTQDFAEELLQVRNPFTMDHDAGLSIYAKRYFAKIMESPDKTEVFHDLKIIFPTVKDASHDIDSLCQLWDSLYVAVESVSKSKQMGTVESKKFERTNKWLSEHR